ncbi:hypothetical protein ACHAW5_002618 [Stephanodiscus triporus]|uniref:Uncharacterized protein n=1 Tax=Stephanodiscus triporus TaxID=2934178 RepID=A0ABD3NEF8_9STRA
MLRDIVSKARIGASAELEAMTAERDFFREKYSEQMVVMEQLRGKLRDSQRVIDKLRSLILDVEVEKSRSVQHSGAGKAVRLIGGISGRSSNTSLTSFGEDQSLRSRNADDRASLDECANDKVSPVVRDSVTPTSNTNDTDDERSATSEQSIEDEKQAGEEESRSSEDDEADKIRANAERMLQWAQYQTSKRSTPNTSIVQECTDGPDGESMSPRSAAGSKGVSESIVLPMIFDERRSRLLDDNDDSTLGSYSTHRSERSAGTRNTSGTTSKGTPKGGKIGKLFNNLRDMIDPPSESESEGGSDEDSTDGISR